jgi:hypothetical protein
MLVRKSHDGRKGSVHVASGQAGHRRCAGGRRQPVGEHLQTRDWGRHHRAVRDGRAHPQAGNPRNQVLGRDGPEDLRATKGQARCRAAQAKGPHRQEAQRRLPEGLVRTQFFRRGRRSRRHDVHGDRQPHDRAHVRQARISLDRPFAGQAHRGLHLPHRGALHRRRVASLDPPELHRPRTAVRGRTTRQGGLPSECHPADQRTGRPALPAALSAPRPEARAVRAGARRELRVLLQEGFSVAVGGSRGRRRSGRRPHGHPSGADSREILDQGRRAHQGHSRRHPQRPHQGSHQGSLRRRRVEDPRDRVLWWPVDPRQPGRDGHGGSQRLPRQGEVELPHRPTILGDLRSSRQKSSSRARSTRRIPSAGSSLLPTVPWSRS